jgi:hypothetical protein
MGIILHIQQESQRISRKIRGTDVVEIRQTFGDRESAIEWENRVLRRIGAVKSEKWLNRFDGKAVHPDDALRGAKQKKPNRKRLDAAVKKRF